MNYTEGVAEVTQADRDDAQDMQHEHCIQCNELVCKQGDDGLLLSACSCDAAEGEPVRDEGGVIGYVHAACREQLLIEQLQQDIERALNIRLPLGMQPWAAERAANIASMVFQRSHEFGMRFGEKIEAKGD